jgi:hypothetical protein
LIVLGGLVVYTMTRPPATEVGTFEECAQAGYPVRETQPRICTTTQGKVFKESSATPE